MRGLALDQELKSNQRGGFSQECVRHAAFPYRAIAGHVQSRFSLRARGADASPIAVLRRENPGSGRDCLGLRFRWERLYRINVCAPAAERAVSIDGVESNEAYPFGERSRSGFDRFGLCARL